MHYDLTEADKRCDLCVEGTSRIKDHLTQDWIDKWVAQKTEYCNRLSDDAIKQMCLQRIAEGKRDYEYLLNHSALEYCRWIGNCPKLLQLNANGPTDTPCDHCLKFYSQVKPKLSPNWIKKTIDRETKECNTINDELEKQDCLTQVEELKHELVYLMEHSVRQFCQWIQDCP